MGCRYPEVSLADIAVITTGKSNRQDAVENGKYIFFDRSQEAKRSARYLYDAKAIIVPGEGKEFIPRYFEGKFDLHQRAYAVIPNEKCNSRFVYYAVSYRRSHFANIAVGSTVKSLRLASFETMQIPLPDIATQDAIALVLACLDKKIASNTRLNGYLAA